MTFKLFDAINESTLQKLGVDKNALKQQVALKPQPVKETKTAELVKGSRPFGKKNRSTKMPEVVFRKKKASN